MKKTLPGLAVVGLMAVSGIAQASVFGCAYRINDGKTLYSSVDKASCNQIFNTCAAPGFINEFTNEDLQTTAEVTKDGGVGYVISFSHGDSKTGLTNKDQDESSEKSKFYAIEAAIFNNLGERFNPVKTSDGLMANLYGAMCYSVNSYTQAYMARKSSGAK